MLAGTPAVLGQVFLAHLQRLDEQVPALKRLAGNAEANGVEGLRLIDGAAARAMEPALHAVAALHSSATGLIDSHGFMLALLGEAEDHGAALALKSPLSSAEVVPGGFVLDVGGAEQIRLQSRCLVKSAALAASNVAALIDGLVRHTGAPRTAARATTFRWLAHARRSRTWSIRCTTARAWVCT